MSGLFIYKIWKIVQCPVTKQCDFATWFHRPYTFKVQTTPAPMDQYDLITRNLAEVITESQLRQVIEKPNPSIYWGTTPTNSPSIAYFFPLKKIADFLQAKLAVKILIADVHAALDGVSWELIEHRSVYYEHVIKTMLSALQVPLDTLEFVRGRDIQLSPKYAEDLLKLSTYATVHDATKASSEVVKQQDNPKLSGLIYPLMQALDEEYLGVDIQFGGVDQRKIFMFAREYMPKIGYSARVELMNPMIPGLVGEKMSSSVASSKIDVLDDEQTLQNKMKKADFDPQHLNNGVLGLVQYLLFPLFAENKLDNQFTIQRPEKFGGTIAFSSFESLKEAIQTNQVHPLDIKQTTARYLNELLKPIQDNKQLIELHKQAYPQ